MSGATIYPNFTVDVHLPSRPHGHEILPDDYPPWAFFGLRDEDIDEMSDTEMIHAIIAARQLECRAQASKARVIARLDRVRGGSRSVADELAPELRITRQAAQTQVAMARELLSRMPSLLAAMEAGELDEHKARQAFDATAPLSDGLARKVDAIVAQRIGTKHPAAWRKCVTRVVSAIDPGGVKNRAEARRKDRQVTLIHEPDAMASLWAYLPAEVASAVYARVDAMARRLKTRTEERTMDQLRADVLADILLGTLDSGLGGIAAQIFIHIPVTAALEINDHGCELVGHGPVPAHVARGLMNDPKSVLRKVVTDPVLGSVLDVGRTRYRPPAAMTDVVRARDRTCRAPGCSHPAQQCDRDHARAKNGTTSSCNICCLCRYHHTLKDEPGWHYQFDGDTGRLTVTTPTGRQHTTLPEPLVEPIDTTPPPF